MTVITSELCPHRVQNAAQCVLASTLMAAIVVTPAAAAAAIGAIVPVATSVAAEAALMVLTALMTAKTAETTAVLRALATILRGITAEPLLMALRGRQTGLSLRASRVGGGARTSWLSQSGTGPTAGLRVTAIRLQRVFGGLLATVLTKSLAAAVASLSATVVSTKSTEPTSTRRLCLAWLCAAGTTIAVHATGAAAETAVATDVRLRIASGVCGRSRVFAVTRLLRGHAVTLVGLAISTTLTSPIVSAVALAAVVVLVHVCLVVGRVVVGVSLVAVAWVSALLALSVMLLMDLLALRLLLTAAAELRVRSVIATARRLTIAALIGALLEPVSTFCDVAIHRMA